MPVIMVTVSDRGSQRIGDLTKTDTGFGPIMAGIGTQMSGLVGQPITTGDGPILMERGGVGFPELNGHRPGSLGGKVTIDRTGRDTGTLGDRHDLEGPHAAFGRCCLSGLDDCRMALSQAPDDLVGAPVNHRSGRSSQIQQKD